MRAVRQRIVRDVGIGPAYLVPVGPAEIPKTSLGKIQRRALQAAARTPAQSTPPGTAPSVQPSSRIGMGALLSFALAAPFVAEARTRAVYLGLEGQVVTGRTLDWAVSQVWRVFPAPQREDSLVNGGA